MPREFVLAGRSLGTERPFMDKRFDNLANLSADFGGESKLVALAYDTRHRTPVTNNPILWLVGESNKKIYACDARTMQVIEGFSFPIPPTGITPPSKCYGLAILSEPTDCIIAFLSEPSLDSTGCPILFHLRYTPGASTPQERLKVENWYYVNTTAAVGVFQLSEANRGMTEYRGDFMILGTYGGMKTIMYIDKYGMPLASYAGAFKSTDDPRGLVHIHQRTYTTIDGTDVPAIGGRYLAKFITERIDRTEGHMLPLLSIEPFFLPTFMGDMAIYQDRMAACDRDRVYLYKILYFSFIVDDLLNDDIDMGSILIGDSKVKSVKIKNIADYYHIKDVVLSKGTVTCPGNATNCPAKEALAWVKFSTTNPAESADPGIWADTITLATTAPYIAPDGEQEFWIKVAVPVNYAALQDTGGSPLPVSVDDGPFVVPLEVVAKVG